MNKNITDAERLDFCAEWEVRFLERDEEGRARIIVSIGPAGVGVMAPDYRSAIDNAMLIMSDLNKTITDEDGDYKIAATPDDKYRLSFRGDELHLFDSESTAKFGALLHALLMHMETGKTSGVTIH